MKTKLLLIALAISMSTLSFAQTQPDASLYTKQANEHVVKELDFSNTQDFKDANRGFIAKYEGDFLVGENGKNIYDLSAWNFLNAEAPSTVNPSLWRQSQLNKIHGLFEVVSGKVYQARGYDISNVTFVRTNNGWIVIDVATSKESAKVGYDLLKKHVADLPIRAIIITHPHPDHFSGVDAIIEGCPNKDKSKIEIIAPEGYFQEAINESLMAGVAMERRARFMYGYFLNRDGKGAVGSGLGQTNSSGSRTLHQATREIKYTGEKLKIDGLEMEFMSVPGAEAPCEIMIYFPQFKSFCVAEEINRTLHNLVTLRGAKVRNGQLWSKYIDEALVRYGDNVEVSFSTHHWPTWGNKAIVDYWEKQRDMYRYIHDQTLHLANKGYTPKEIAEMIKLPKSISKEFANREYYGTVSHNAKAQYQLYFGWFDGVPANLNPLPPTEEGKKYVAAFGGAEVVLEKAKEAYEKGEYRWCATLINHLVFAQPEHKDARKILADAYYQMGYQAESGPWRNFYLQGAKELIEGVDTSIASLFDVESMIPNVSIEMLFDVVATKINGEKAADKDLIINIRITDTKEQASLILKNGALTNRPNVLHKNPHLTLSGSRRDIILSFALPQTLSKNIADKKIILNGKQDLLDALFSSLEPSNPYFNIVEP
ncbi:MAG: alkyl/aryl-sulfatase [Bacteroidales bacterium]